MSALFCCPSGTKPYRPRLLSHEAKFEAFLRWMPAAQEASTDGSTEGRIILSEDSSAYAVQVVRQVNYGALESKRYFVSGDGGIGTNFYEITEGDLIEANFEKLNAYKNFKCDIHNKFFEFNIYQKNPVNRQHWRADITRPAGEIDLQPR
ncbi:hypothetical protein V495_01088 [Pseudogymnoascus sp. VKM F-4514 (FW-929)]|nr:hypothetical protein V495_01088 [Pseudogymnoascus sp. VKM F-4514 (FW-929)]KFY63532.1 hypothetical protein V497_01982 [Pseudogymnoascus sp. VKM F-4516 (FW-969)]